jgi:hypothetical protein
MISIIFEIPITKGKNNFPPKQINPKILSAKKRIRQNVVALIEN